MVTREAFDALLARRDDLERQHTTACAILEEEGPQYAAWNHRKCAKLHDQLTKVQAEIDAAIAAERAAEEASP